MRHGSKALRGLKKNIYGCPVFVSRSSRSPDQVLVVVSAHTRGNDQAVIKIVNWSACEQARARCEVHNMVSWYTDRKNSRLSIPEYT